MVKKLVIQLLVVDVDPDCGVVELKVGRPRLKSFRALLSCTVTSSSPMTASCPMTRQQGLVAHRLLCLRTNGGSSEQGKLLPSGAEDRNAELAELREVISRKEQMVAWLRSKVSEGREGEVWELTDDGRS